jgi:ligand-binding sensor domain-containing protein
MKVWTYKVSLRRTLRITVIAVAALLLGGIGLVRWKAQRAMQGAAREMDAEQSLRVTVRALAAHGDSRFEWIGSPAVFNAAGEYRGHLFICGPSGLEQYDARGKFEQEYRVGRELPASPLVRMAVGVLPESHEPELILASAREGVLAFDGSAFRQIHPADAEAREITAILPLASGRLLIGTEKRGVLVYDGKQITALHATLANVHVTELAGSESDLWVGTLDRGVLHWQAGQTEAFSEAQGLPDAQVLSLSVDGERTFVGTPVGVAVFERGRVAKIVARGAFAQALSVGGSTLFVGTMDQGILRVALEAGGSRAGLTGASGASEIGGVRQIFTAQGRAEEIKNGHGENVVYALSQDGLYALGGPGRDWKKVLEPRGGALTDRNISALAVQTDGKLWVGYFDRGLDIVEADGGRARHFEDENIFCVNRVVAGHADETVAVATANGLVLFDRAGNLQKSLGRADGLISDHITDVTFEAGRMVVATPAGITFLDADGPRSLYAFQGLTNNHVYTLAATGSRVLAGTLGGLSVLEHEQVVASYTTGNSSLQRNWIAAVAPLGHDWMIGTYGGGIVRLDDGGRFHSYDVATTANLEINPNAMLVTERHVFAGSLGKGLFVYDRGTDRWTKVTEGLPSENVTALAGDKEFIYIGTDNGLVRIREKEFGQ